MTPITRGIAWAALTTFALAGSLIGVCVTAIIYSVIE